MNPQSSLLAQNITTIKLISAWRYFQKFVRGPHLLYPHLVGGIDIFLEWLDAVVTIFWDIVIVRG